MLWLLDLGAEVKELQPLLPWTCCIWPRDLQQLIRAIGFSGGLGRYYFKALLHVAVEAFEPLAVIVEFC